MMCYMCRQPESCKSCLLEMPPAQQQTSPTGDDVPGSAGGCHSRRRAEQDPAALQAAR